MLRAFCSCITFSLISFFVVLSLDMLVGQRNIGLESGTALAAFFAFGGGYDEVAKNGEMSTSFTLLYAALITVLFCITALWIGSEDHGWRNYFAEHRQAFIAQLIVTGVGTFLGAVWARARKS